MTKEQMLEQWVKTFEQGYYKYNFSTTVYDYLEERIDQVPETIIAGPKGHGNYESWIVKELNGELAWRFINILLHPSLPKTSLPAS